MSIDSKSTYYDVNGIEVIDFIRAKLTPEQFKGYCLGNAIKYLGRANWKHDTTTRDVEKAAHYLGMIEDSYRGIQR